MQITHVETYPVEVPIKRERWMISSLGQHRISRYLLVRVLTDTGIEGAGEATVTARWSGETVWSARAMVDRVLAPRVIGCDPADVEHIDRQMDAAAAHNWFAKSAIEMACWDIRGKAEGRPVHELLGGAVRSRAIRSRYSMGAYEPDHAAARARELVGLGFTTIKIKVGTGVAADIARVRAVREAVGSTIDLTVDANCGWSADEAIHAMHELEDCRLSLNEQPTPDGDYAAMARVRRETSVPVMADDMCFNLVHARELVRNACCDVISVYPGKNGGIRKSREIVEFAARSGVSCSIGSNLELDIATAAMAHLVLACPNMDVERYPGDLLGADYHEVRVAKNPVQIKGPITTIGELPGLGVEVDWNLVRNLGGSLAE
ncbi:MAG TPA: enolase C-terminal domain-like protein [Pirellulales bacterium]|jgi:L-alanine-DL-glutamate epimerase-like enolase superfamily enzyme|nr:enolase C-terminal domain-like protein [Pirellulales bacterium]